MALPQSRTPFFILALTVLIVPRVYSQDSSTNANRPWRVPSRFARKKNPIPTEEKAVTNGRFLYERECLTCHGVQGKGDGPSSYDLEEKVMDLAEPQVSNQTDGALFFKITVGRKPMPSYRQLLTDDERWGVVHYLRTLMPQP